MLGRASAGQLVQGGLACRRCCLACGACCVWAHTWSLLRLSACVEPVAS